MRNPEGESDHGPLRPLFDRRLKLEFHGSRVTSDAGLLAYRELDDALGLTALAGGVLADSRTGRNGWHGIVSLLRQSVYGRLAGYEDVNDADRLGRDPAMRWIVGGKAVERGGASTSQMGRFETELLANNENLAALADLSGTWIDRVHDHDPRVGFIVTNLGRPAERVVAFYNQRGTAEQWIKEGKNAIRWTRLSCRRFDHNAVRLQLHALAYNLGNFMRTLALPDAVEQWSLTSLREKLIKIGAKIVRHGRYVTFQMAEVVIPRDLFANILRRIDRLRPPPAPA